MQLSKKNKAYLSLAAISFCWGTTWMATKIGVQHMPALSLAATRQLIAGIIFTTFFLLKGHKLPGIKQMLHIAVLSLFFLVFSNGLTTWGLKYIPSGLGSVIGAIVPIWMALFSFAIYRTSKITASTVLGLLLGLSGIFIVFYEFLPGFFNPDFRIGIILSFAATISWSLGTVLTAKQEGEINPYFSLGLQMLISGLILKLAAIINGDAVNYAEVNIIAWASIAYLVSVGSLLAFVAYIYALKNLPTTQVSIYAYINPIVALIIGWLFLDEKLTVIVWLGTFTTIAGIYLINRDYLKARLKKK